MHSYGSEVVAAVATLPDWLSLIAGISIVAATASSVLRTLVATRGLSSAIAFSAARTVRFILVTIARRTSDYYKRDWIQTWIAPLAIVAMLGTWLFLFLVGYALILNADASIGLGNAIREAGSSLFTLGFATTDRAQLTAVDFFAAATGPIVIGLMIGYLPSLYASYNRREVDVALLNARAGEPNWGPEVLFRHAVVDNLDQLPTLWQAWERWAADVAESHSAYQTLIFMRSARPQRNWLIALLSVMDSAALNMSLRPSDPQGAPRVAIRQGVECIRDLALAVNLPHDHDPSPDDDIDLTFEEFAEAIAGLEAVGYLVERTAEEAWPHFKGWRINYEQTVYQLAMLIDAVPAKWSGPRRPDTAVIPPLRPINRQPGGTSGTPQITRRQSGPKPPK